METVSLVKKMCELGVISLQDAEKFLEELMKNIEKIHVELEEEDSED